MAEYELTGDPNAPASKAQTWAIFTLGGGDVRNDGLTRQQAHELIARLGAAKKAAKGPRAGAPKTKTKAARGGNYHPYAEMLEKAVEAANKAGDEWLGQGQADVGGGAARQPLRRQ